MMTKLAVIFFWLLAIAAEAKPLGVVDCGPNPPSWVTVCTIGSQEDFTNAAHLSQTRGIRWWILITDPGQNPMGPIAQALKEKLINANLYHFVDAVSVGEEWYERMYAGEFVSLGIDNSSANIGLIHAWFGLQHQAVKAIMPDKLIVWLTTMVNHDASFGPALYRPAPLYTDAIALDAYVPSMGTFETHVQPVLAHAEVTTTLPLILMPQWFWIPNDPLWGRRPTVEDTEKYNQWALRPRWMGTVGFSLRSRAWGLVGLEDLPDIQTTVTRR